MSKETAKNTVDFANIDIESPTVEIGRICPPADRIVVALNVAEYRTKKFDLVEKSLKLKNVAVAHNAYYSGKFKGSKNADIVYTVQRCVDCCAGSDNDAGKVLSKALAACLASRSSCAVIIDDNDNIYICTLNKNFNYQDISSGDDYSSKYGGLTYLETKGKTRIPDPHDQDKFYKINFLVTSDGYPLVPVRDQEDFLENNHYYYLARGLDGSSSDMVTKLIYVVKSGELERYIRGVFYQGEDY
ncbi:MAG: hypothetical protein ACOYIB_04645 [Desulfosporosinus sp.]